MEIRRPVSLLCTRDAEIPATWGLLRPVILVPADVAEWSDERCRVVLLHELAHIRRMDWLTLLMARLVRILYWYHPLVWLAARMQRIEAEQSCDDQVLSAGLKPSDYARQLLDIVVAFRRPGYSGLAAVAMARKSSLEGRVLSILDPMRRRGPHDAAGHPLDGSGNGRTAGTGVDYAAEFDGSAGRGIRTREGQSRGILSCCYKFCRLRKATMRRSGRSEGSRMLISASTSSWTLRLTHRQTIRGYQQSPTSWMMQTALSVPKWKRQRSAFRDGPATRT